MGQIKKFSQFTGTQLQKEVKSQVEEAAKPKGSVIDIDYLVTIEIQKELDSLYEKLGKEFTKMFKNKSVMFEGKSTKGAKPEKAEGKITSVIISPTKETGHYVTITLESGRTFEDVKEVELL
jgi:predicted transcriptional regulator